MKLWGKGTDIDQNIEDFTVGNDREIDVNLAQYDVIGSIAHAKMLHSIKLLTDKELVHLEEVLLQVLNDIGSGKFTIEDDYEDIHSKIEGILIDKLGETGKKIHTGRSRNDQVLLDLCLYFKDQIIEVKGRVKALFDGLIQLSDMHKDVLMPGYTHMQVAMPSSFGLFFGSYAELLVDDMYMLYAAFKLADQNPLGSAAGYGSSFPINRWETTRNLNFGTMKFNSIAAQLSRGKLEKAVANGLASISDTLGRLAMDICLYSGQNFGFFNFPEEFTTGSSIMPHKKNPDVWELIRAKCNKIRGLPTELALLTTNLPSGYHRDYQELKSPVMSGIESMKACLEIATYGLQHVDVSKELLDDPIYKHITSVESVNEKVINGIPFRDAYREVAREIENGNFVTSFELDHTHEGSIGNLCNVEIKAKMEKAFSEIA